MSKVDYLIVGGGIAGTMAAEFIRIKDSSGSIAIVTEESDRLYSRVLLPHYLRDKIPFEKIYVRELEEYLEKNIELLTNSQVVTVDSKSKKVFLSNAEEIEYKKLLVASGGKVSKLDIMGSDLKGITYLRTNRDAKEIKELMNTVRNGVVIGGGFIGIEFAQSFLTAGLKTTCVVREPYFWSLVVGENSGKLINKILEENGVEVITRSEVSEFVGDSSLSAVKLKDKQRLRSGELGKEIKAEITGVGIGINMDLDFLEGSEIKINKGVITNEYLETDSTDVWAAGDTAEFKDVVFDKHHQLGNWSNAAFQGKVAGENMVFGYGSKNREKFETVSAYTIPIFDGSFTFLGDPSSDQNTELIERGSVEENKMVRLHLRDDKVVGASIINSSSDRSPILNLIKNRVKISVRKEKLADIKFDLGKI